MVISLLTISSYSGKITILTNNKNEITNIIIIKNMDIPYKDVEIVKSAKILDRMCTTNAHTNTDIADRLNKGKTVRWKIRRSFITESKLLIS